MRQSVPPQLIRSGRDYVQLPEGTDIVRWEAERVRFQNPRIRYLLGALNSIEQVLDSDYNILHCSPDRLSEIVRRARAIADSFEELFSPLLEPVSTVPELEEELAMSRRTLSVLRGTVLRDIRGIAFDRESSRQMLQRKLLSVSIGQLHAFLQDCFARIVAADPRSQHDIDYFLSRRFPMEIEASEWLHYSVSDLQDYLESLEKVRAQSLGPVIEGLRRVREVPGGQAEAKLVRFLERMTSDFVPRLRALLTQRGIRYEEMEILDGYAAEVPRICALTTELWSVARTVEARLEEAAESSSGRSDLLSASTIVQTELCERLLAQLEGLDRKLHDFQSFVPIWLQGIEGRRALMLARVGADDRADHGQPPSSGSSRPMDLSRAKPSPYQALPRRPSGGGRR